MTDLLHDLSCSTRREIPYLRAPCIILYLLCSPPPPHVLFSIYRAPHPYPMYYSLFIVLPTPCIILYLSCSPPHPIIEKIRQYNHISSLELPHHIYISIRLKYNLQKFGFVYVNYVNEHKNSGTKSSQTKQRL